MTAPPRAVPQLPPRHHTPNSETARLHGGPAAGGTVTRRRGKDWPRFLDGGTGQAVDGRKGEALLRHPSTNVGVYLCASVPWTVSAYRPAAPVAVGYIHSTACIDRGLAWSLIATALAGSHTGRLLANRSNDPADVLDALVDLTDDLMQLRIARDRSRNATAEPSANRSDR